MFWHKYLHFLAVKYEKVDYIHRFCEPTVSSGPKTVYENNFVLMLLFPITELDDFLQELDEDVEGMQSTVLYLQQELRAARSTVNGNRPVSPADKRTYSGSECSDTPVGKRRRASVLSLDYNEDEEPLTVPNGDAD